MERQDVFREEDESNWVDQILVLLDVLEDAEKAHLKVMWSVLERCVDVVLVSSGDSMGILRLDFPQEHARLFSFITQVNQWLRQKENLSILNREKPGSLPTVYKKLIALSRVLVVSGTSESSNRSEHDCIKQSERVVLCYLFLARFIPRQMGRADMFAEESLRVNDYFSDLALICHAIDKTPGLLATHKKTEEVTLEAEEDDYPVISSDDGVLFEPSKIDHTNDELSPHFDSNGPSAAAIMSNDDRPVHESERDMVGRLRRGHRKQISETSFEKTADGREGQRPIDPTEIESRRGFYPLRLPCHDVILDYIGTQRREIRNGRIYAEIYFIAGLMFLAMVYWLSLEKGVASDWFVSQIYLTMFGVLLVGLCTFLIALRLLRIFHKKHVKLRRPVILTLFAFFCFVWGGCVW